ncbi:hypothetical protein EW14_1258 [Prochlorococcus sp. MIT 0604]|nr:hypothetical protein EW14_1258 [Prochlorococcus sp. MIT 0604]
MKVCKVIFDNFFTSFLLKILAKDMFNLCILFGISLFIIFGLKMFEYFLSHLTTL